MSPVCWIYWVSKQWAAVVNDREVWKYVDCTDLFVFDKDLYEKLKKNQKVICVFKLNGKCHIIHPLSIDQIVSVFSNLRELDLSGTTLNHLNFIRYMKQVEVLKLNSVTLVAPWMFGQWLPKLKHLKELYLRNNFHLFHWSVSYIAQAIPTLEVYDCTGLDQIPLNHVTAVLESCPNLKVFYFTPVCCFKHYAGEWWDLLANRFGHVKFSAEVYSRPEIIKLKK